MPEKSNRPTSAKSAKKLGLFNSEPIFIPLEPPNENPLPEENASWPKVVMIGGLLVALVCAWWFAPAMMDELWQNLIRRLFHFAGQ